MNRQLCISAALCALLSASSVLAEDQPSASGEVTAKCKMPAQPTVPNGRNATKDDMLAAQKAMKAYMTAGDEYIACLKGVEAGWGDSITDEQKAVIVIFNNRAVDDMQAVADLFNQAVRAFKGREGQ